MGKRVAGVYCRVRIGEEVWVNIELEEDDDSQCSLYVVTGEGSHKMSQDEITRLKELLALRDNLVSKIDKRDRGDM